jgi:flagellin
MVINTNLQAQFNADNLQTTQTRLNKSLARLSSGTQIIAPSDAAAGLAVATRLDAQAQRTNAANKNVSGAISFTQTQDGYLRSMSKALNRMSELSIQALDVTKTDTDRALYDSEFTQLKDYITQAANKDFNGVSLFTANALDVTMDADGNTFSMAGIDLTTDAFTAVGSSTVSTTSGATSALASIKTAITELSADRANIGAYQTRLNYVAEQLTVSRQNLSAASSQIEDVEVANESTEFARQNVLLQSGTAMLAQANQLPQSVLRLLQ